MSDKRTDRRGREIDERADRAVGLVLAFVSGAVLALLVLVGVAG